MSAWWLPKLASGIAVLGVGLSPARADWWSQADLVGQCGRWLAESSADPDRAAERLAQLADPATCDRRRAGAALSLLAADPRFPDALKAVLNSRTNAYTVDRALGRDETILLDVLLRLLADRAGSPPRVRARCATLLRDCQQPQVTEVLTQCLLKDDDRTVQTVAARAVRLAEMTPELQRKLLERSRSPALAARARQELVDTFGHVGSDSMVEFLIGEAGNVFQSSPGTDSNYRTAVLESLQGVSLTLRRRSPRGVARANLVEACRQLWDRRQSETGLEAATICLVWARLLPERFRKEMDPRRADPGFWREAAEDPKALGTWCHAVADYWAWPSPERRQTIRDLVQTGRAHLQTESERSVLSVALTRFLAEWPILVAVDALSSDDPGDRAAGRLVLSTIGPTVEGEESVQALCHLAFPVRPVFAKAALAAAGGAPPAIRWSAKQLQPLAAKGDFAGELRPLLNARSAVLQEAAAALLLQHGNLDDWWQMSRTAPPLYRNKARSLLARRGHAGPALEWAAGDPAGFVDALSTVLRQGPVEQSAAAAALLHYLYAPAGHDPSHAAKMLRRLFPKGSFQQRSLELARNACLNSAARHRAKYEWAIKEILRSPPCRRADAVADGLEALDDVLWRVPIEDYRRRAAKKPVGFTGNSPANLVDSSRGPEETGRPTNTIPERSTVGGESNHGRDGR